MPTDSRSLAASEPFSCQPTQDEATRILRGGKLIHNAHRHAGRAAGQIPVGGRARSDPAHVATSTGTFERGNERWRDHLGA